ncbi:MAG: hypothetical protein GXY41_08115 [Phycisphaerae bacterium]|nr:hypothetical protein [Phycisphaerae bacterium]
MAEKKYKPVLVTDQMALELIYRRANVEHRRLSNAAAATIIESATTPQRQSFKDEIREKSIPNLENG